MCWICTRAHVRLSSRFTPVFAQPIAYLPLYSLHDTAYISHVHKTHSFKSIRTQWTTGAQR